MISSLKKWQVNLSWYFPCMETIYFLFTWVCVLSALVAQTLQIPKIRDLNTKASENLFSLYTRNLGATF